ncbi:3-deoxy-manno-octulosonate cytidylyltransferase [Vibrio furnissii]|uniref:3-deoxy-manno-octulosonate cytidylyltransferase n=1 Tax=Vibrio furnissii TaxID=29494 RepID=UPI0023DC859F|nr:3-deoxy-manno-octulosonate cytidylyltransferase [Vibrio furnissii]
MNKDNYAVIIPARFKSSRFPGKPLVDICGKPMIQHVWERCVSAVGADKVYVATDDQRIAEAAAGFGSQVVMTSDHCLTGTDRLAEANLTLDLDFVINVQGDEPMINPDDIRLVRDRFLQTGNVTNAMCRICSKDEFFSLTVPKVVTSKSGKLLYMSRGGVPFNKEGEFKEGWKQVCIYAFSREQLAFFAGNATKTPLEQYEDIEILRFLENDYQIDMVEVEVGSLAVDVPNDVGKVVRAINA